MSNADRPESETATIEVRDLRKSFGNVQALQGISFDLREGEFLTLFGPNGAGKTTLIKILSALTRPTSGTAKVAGYDVQDGDPAMRRQIGVISHATCLYGDLTPLENLTFYARMFDLSDPQDRAVEVIDQVGLKPRMHDRVHTFSRGMLQRLSIARAIIHRPTVLFLDEPFTGLDQHAAKIFKENLETLHSEKRTVIMTTHDIGRGLETCDRVAIQVRGKIVYTESIDRVDRDDFERLYFDTVQEHL